MHAVNAADKRHTFSDGRNEKNVDERRSISVTEQRDSVGVTAECRYVLFDPVQRCDQVQDCVVARSTAILRAEETCAFSNY